MSTKVATERSHTHAPPDDRTQVQAVLRHAGLLVEPSPATLASAAQSTLTLEEAIAILSRGDGPSLSAQLDEERGPKDER